MKILSNLPKKAIQLYSQITHLPPWCYGALYAFLIPFFAALYLMGQKLNPEKDFSNSIDCIDAFYFSVITITTLGYGDIRPLTEVMKILAATEVILGIFTIGLFLSALAEKKSKITAEEQLGWLTGGDSIPFLQFSSNSCFDALQHFSGDYPLYDVSVALQEYWVPLPDEVLPENYFYQMRQQFPMTEEMLPYKSIGTQHRSIMLPNRIDMIGDDLTFDPISMMFPESGKFMLRVSLVARNGNFSQYIAGRRNSETGLTEYQMVLFDNTGKAVNSSKNWEKVTEVIHPRGNKTFLDTYVYDWDS